MYCLSKDPSAKIADDVQIGPNVVIGPNVTIETGACLSRCVVMKDAKIQSHSWIQSSIIGWKSVVGRWVGTNFLVSGTEMLTSFATCELDHNSSSLKLLGVASVSMQECQ